MARQRWHKVVLWAAGTVLVAGVALVLAVLFTKQADAPEHSVQKSCIEIGSKCFALETVDTDEARQRGLSGREGLDKNTGMLFVFDRPSTQYCFWMKDMKFSIDMIWLNEQKEVIKIEPSVSPASYPNNFCPESPAQYVVELASGEAEAIGLSVGSIIDL